ncbi:MAG: class I SAM-dependent methyltransferase [Deltaproteobacteria bacterium]|nr:class I SAM-dependent methyltransferase [Deltaproteobacteria bacterium]
MGGTIFHSGYHRFRQLLRALRHLGARYSGHYRLAGVKGILRLTVALFLLRFGRLYSQIGHKRRYCPCCGWHGRNFLPLVAGGYVCFRLLCPVCRWQPRHRAHRIFYDRCFKMGERQGRLLYFAPEDRILNYLKTIPNLHVQTSSYCDKSGDYDIDIMNIPFTDNTWDYIICHHVIEHIRDDRKGMCELYRILKPGGTLILSVPIDAQQTEYWGAPNPLRNNHYYNYGPDFVNRIPLEFNIVRYSFVDLFSKQEFEEMGLLEEYLFVCKKPIQGLSTPSHIVEGEISCSIS